MESLLIYLLKSGIAIGAFFLCHYFLFRKYSEFHFNRLYMLISFMLAFIIPLITITIVKEIVAQPITNTGSNIATTTLLEPSISNKPIDALPYVFFIYIAGVFISIIHLIIGHRRAFSIIKNSRTEIKYSTEVCVSHEDIHPFSFFNKIILSEQTLNHPEVDLIIAHENIHVKQKHTWDMLFAEFLFSFQWFNPFAWLLKDAIKTNLEYLADAQIIETADAETYQLTMVSLADKKGIAPFLTALNGSQLKNRITMMKQKTKNKFLTMKRFAIIPVLAILVMGLSNKKFENVPNSSKLGSDYLATDNLKKEFAIKGSVTDLETGAPIPGASIIIQGKPVGTITNIEGKFIINVSEEDEALVFTSLKHEKQTIKIEGKELFDVKMKGLTDNNSSKNFIEIRKHIARQIKCPAKAALSGIPVEISVNTKIDNNGLITITDQKASSNSIKLEFVVKAYKPTEKNEISIEEVKKVCRNECIRVIKKLNKVNNTKLMGQEVEFNFKFDYE